MFDLPEKAIRCFEMWSGTTVVIHGYSNIYELMIDVDRTNHQHVLCRQAKRSGEGKFCEPVDVEMLSGEIGRFRNGGMKRCRAGLLEWFMPVWDDIQLQAILFAGVRTAPAQWTPAVPFLDFDRAEPGRCRWPGRLIAPGEDELVLEGLAQLAARLKQFFDPIRENVIADHQNIPRDVLIRYLICRNYHKPGKSLEIISRALSLSKSRTLHVIKEETGQNLLDLLNSVRLNKACFLLHSSLEPVHVIAETCGFGNISNFFRLFRKRYGVTPLNYRKQARRCPDT